MATKVGNGGHGQESYDPKTGQYIDSGNISTADLEELGLDLNLSGDEFDFLNEPEIEKVEINIKDEFKEGRTILEAETIGNMILGSNKFVVNYSEDTDLRCANEMNKALYDIYNDFPDLFDVLLKYGDIPISDNMTQNIIIKQTQKKLNDIVVDFNLSFKEKEQLNSILDFSVRGGILNTYLTSERKYGKIHTYKEKYKIPFFGISINKKYTSSKEKFDDSHHYDYISGFHYNSEQGGAYATSAHELGHFIDQALRIKVSDLGSRKISDKLNQLKETGKRSRYGMKNNAEFVAEAFSDVYSNGDAAQEMNKELVAFYKEVYTNGIQ